MIKNLTNGVEVGSFFIQMDIKNYFPSITEALLKKSIQWARNYTNITEVLKNSGSEDFKTHLESENQPRNG